jgi:hypothetical protein
VKRFWMSWWEPSLDGDARPFVVPPESEVPYYWMSGTRGDDDAEETSICAVVVAGDMEQARAVVGRYWKPCVFRFIEEKPDLWFPESDRFPRKTTAASPTGV